MGMGEPFANQEAVFDSLEIIHSGFGLGARRLTVSTVGLIPGILALAKRPEPFRLAVSLHAPNHEMRLLLVPLEKRYPIDDLFAAIDEYQGRKGRRVTLEYTLIGGLNDGQDTARELVDLVGKRLVFVNLIPWNPIPWTRLEIHNWRSGEALPGCSGGGGSSSGYSHASRKGHRCRVRTVAAIPGRNRRR